jgi:hypothetical protein
MRSFFTQFSQVWSLCQFECFILTKVGRVLDILHCGGRLRCCHDIQGCANLWEEESTDLPVNLLNRGIGVRHVGESNWNRGQVDFRREQPVYASFDLRLHHRDRSLHYDADELFQQGSKPVPYVHVSVIELESRSLLILLTESIPYTMSRSPPPHFAPHSLYMAVSTPRMPSIHSPS